MMNKFEQFIELLRKHRASTKAIYLLIAAALFSSGLTYYAITDETQIIGPDPSAIIRLVLIDLIILLALVILITRKIFKNLVYRVNDKVGGRLRNRIIVMFSLVAAIPTIIISIFSAYFFNFGLQSWFNKRLENMLHYSVTLSDAYISEYTLQMKRTAGSISEDLGDMYYDLVHTPNLFNKVLNAQAEIRSLDEAIVFQRGSKTVLAQTSMSFSLAFLNIPGHILSLADQGEVIEIKSDPGRVRMLVKLKEYNDTYLLIGRMIDQKLVDYVNKIGYAVKDYEKLNANLGLLQIQFSIAFIVVAMLLLVIAIGGGMIFAGQIIGPIRRLLIATEKLQIGDLSVQVEEGHKDDELSILSSAFNKMVQQLDRQQKDLMVAQRALAWSDVARMVAHEIKNPLTPIQLASSRLQQKFENEVTDKESFNKYIKTILRHTSDIGTILNEFVNFAKMPSPNLIRTDLVTLLRELVESRSMINDKNQYKFVTDLPFLEFICDPTQMHQVIINLLKNSEESIEDAKKEGKIEVSLYKKDDKVIIVVIDNGSGFPLDAISKVTEPYFTTRMKGTGLGLAIVQKIIADHRGQITISNLPDGGAEVKVTFDGA
jgi:two-component system nitrogen regulation sensor histidine kinase NtrY